LAFVERIGRVNSNAARAAAQIRSHMAAVGSARAV
jgi:hypothetical protein